MRIAELLGRRRTFSFEFFPPKTDEAAQQLERTIAELRDLAPSFVSVTYGAGGSTRDKTIEIVTHIKRETGIEAMAHLTCLCCSREELELTLARIVEAGVENVLALRGDPPRDQTSFAPTDGGFRYANELVRFIRDLHGPALCLGGACYPEKHIEAPDPEIDLANLKRKVDDGLEFIITQLFFDNRHYFDFLKRAHAAGVTVPIIPGIMPITNVAQVERFTKMCGAAIPADLAGELNRIRDNPQAVLQLGVAHATAQCVELLGNGAPGIHFYTLNRSTATREIFAALQAEGLA